MILLAGGFCTAALAVHLTTVATVLARIRGVDEPLPPPLDAPGVTVIRPVCGIENYVEQTLRSAFWLDYPNYEILFCAASERDAAVPMVRKLIVANPHVPARLLIGNDAISANPKLNNLAKGWHAARHDMIVMVDSNVLMRRDHIQRMLAAWQPDTGMVCSPPAGVLPENFWAEVECAFLNTYQARWQCFADSVGLGFGQGKTMLWRRPMLDDVGGIKALASEIAEDAAATKVVRQAGLRVRLMDEPVVQPLGSRSAAEVWRRQMRWARLRRDTFKLLFLPELFAGGMWPLAVCAALTALTGWAGLAFLAALAAAWYGSELMLARAAGWPLSRRTLAACLLRDLLLPVLWIASWTGDEFEWRGNAMRVADQSRAA